MAEVALQGSKVRRALPLRSVLLWDAASCIALGASLVALAEPLSAWFALPVALLWWAGAALFPCAALMAAAAWRPHRALVHAIVLGNVAWVAASMAVLVLLRPTGLGAAFVVLQAAAVAGLAGLEWRRAARSAQPAFRT